jgi:predicted site-specific integrase-resolvase
LDQTLLTTGEAARLANVAIQTIHNWAERGVIEVVEEYQNRKRVRKVVRSSLEGYIQQLEHKSDKM